MFSYFSVMNVSLLFRVFVALVITVFILCLKYDTSKLIPSTKPISSEIVTTNFKRSPFPIQQEASVSPVTPDSCRQPIQHVYYLKNHKAGSSTLFAIMAEYCRSHQLLALLPIFEHINQQTPLQPQKQLLLHPGVQHYDMVFNHHVYDPAIFNYLHKDTFKFTMIREPFKHFVSAFTYFKDTAKQEYLIKLNRYKDPITAFLKNPVTFEAKGFVSYTNNRQSVDLGYDIRKYSFSNESYISRFINQTEERFDLILITEYFMESVVLLKRALNWCTEDTLFYAKNVHAKSKRVLANMTEWHRERHRTFSQPDIKLYQHFLSLFKQKMSRAIGLQEEISELKIILGKVRNFCSKTDTEASPEVLEIPSGRWSDRISIRKSKCEWLKLEELSVTHRLQHLQMRKLGVVKHPK